MAARPKEPSTAPQAEHWYPLQLGSSLKDPSKRFYFLRYEFKPASIDTSRPGSLHKDKGAEVTVELSNNQPGKPKVAFQGISEDCKDSDAILFFDGRTFRLERLHRAVKSLRHLRLPGESAASSSSALAAPDNRSPLHLNGTSSASAGDDANVYRGPREHIEEIVIGGQPEAAASNKKNEKKAAGSKGKSKAAAPSPPPKRSHADEFSPVDMEDDAAADAKKLKPSGGVLANNVEHIDVSNNMEEGMAEHESDYELEDVDVSEDEDGQLNSKPPPLSIESHPAVPDHPESKASSSESGSSSSSEGGSGSSSGSDGSDDESASLLEI
ncbi:hypothetical protein SELMODRAFT_424406 [Selaginella moellendorffii]|uniref:Transcription elongation factor Eaf N-terminal domain-containing protein n=1 Tax=Selaginella moellendorffii TaxID=88036 RepID=D8SPS7_SELML|nr:ELL-associated factor 2 [Selaginella moellendorffii]EFJ13469.1 hypothetical protein SELMODRAFT_424406 [Selaginella moellendorffii]|eukprot:XP_002985339.1 ELL-associated factor 2 [Selaginella moellendorffii]